MISTGNQDKGALDARVTALISELRRESSRLVGEISAATGKQYAIVLVAGTDDDYVDVIPELILEDVLRVVPHGWPEDFDIQLLNPAST